MSHYYQFETQYEFFELSLNIFESRISSKDLRSYLLQLEKLVESINQTLNSCDVGCYDEISIDVLALEKGSLKLPLSIKKLFNSNHFNNLKELTKNPTAAIIIGNIIVNLFMGGIYYREHFHDVHEQCGIEYREFLNNTNTAKAVKEISKLTIDNDSIDDFSVTYEDVDGKKKMITISKSQLRETKEFMECVIKHNTHPTLRSGQLVEIISPDFSIKDSKWKLLLDGRIIEAKMLDRDFLHYINENNLAFRKGDALIVDIKIQGLGKHKEYSIKQVYDFQPRNQEETNNS